MQNYKIILESDGVKEEYTVMDIKNFKQVGKVYNTKEEAEAFILSLEVK